MAFATLEWVDRFNNHRLLDVIGNRPSAEAEYHRQRECTELPRKVWMPMGSPRRVMGGTLTRYGDAPAYVQSSTEIPGTRLNSSVFAVTTVRPRDRACPAII